MPWPTGVALCPVAYGSLPGWTDFDFTRIWPTFQVMARALGSGLQPLRAAQAPQGDLAHLLRLASGLPASTRSTDIRRFFEDHCELCRVAAPGFLTGYYEPVVEGSLDRTSAFSAPILPRPADLVTLAPGQPAPGMPEGYAAARQCRDGTLEPYPDRAALEQLALEASAEPLVWLRDWTEVFLIHVQGSARVRLPDGSERRLVYAGRNGHPYTSIGRLLVEAGEIAPAEMSLDCLKSWIRRQGQEVGQPGRALMQRNRSYIFFDMVESTDAGGPTGGAGLPLAAGVSIAVDRALWSYGLPFWIETEASLPGFGPHPLAQLFVAQDTGSAIVGPARIDLFLGSGDAAGAAAGRIRHPARVTVLRPKPS